MEEIKLYLTILIILVLLTMFLPNARASVLLDIYNSPITIGIGTSVLVPENMIWHRTKDLQWYNENLTISYGRQVSDRFHLYLRTDLGYYQFKSNGTNFNLGCSIISQYDIVKYKGIRLFGEIGVGLGYWSNSPNNKTVRPNCLGLIQYGAGLKIPIKSHVYIQPAYRFTHVSSLLGHDSGINSHGMLVELVYTK